MKALSIIFLISLISLQSYATNNIMLTDIEIEGFLGFKLGSYFDGKEAISKQDRHEGLSIEYELSINDFPYEKVSLATNKDSKIVSISAFNKQDNCDELYPIIRSELQAFYKVDSSDKNMVIKYTHDNQNIKLTAYCVVGRLYVLVKDLNAMRKVKDEIAKRKQEIKDNLPDCLSVDGYQRPVLIGWLSSGFGFRTDPFTAKKTWHNGIDLAGKLDSLVYASGSGVVTFTNDQSDLSDHGLRIEIKHGNSDITSYSHLNEFLVVTGQRVKRGQPIGKMGSTGRSTGSHVGFELVKEGKHIDPLKYMADEKKCNNVYLNN
jgi:hypothetical protein